jgi:hypothetical protein
VRRWSRQNCDLIVIDPVAKANSSIRAMLASAAAANTVTAGALL